MKKLIAGNWKMNGLEAGAVSLIGEIGSKIGAEPEILERCDFLVCPPALHIHVVKHKIDHDHIPVAIGGQDCASTENGAFTGNVSAEMLKDAGCAYVILGHSERRSLHNESSAYINEKAARAHMQGLTAVICVGEQEDERESGNAYDVVAKQLWESVPKVSNAATTVIAYEPVWAIGTGKSATPDDVKAMHAFIREKLQENLAESANMRILYGGSVKPDNAADLFKVDNVDGALIGGASLKADQFLGIAQAV
ncbi:MAG: triose-phosphate isomerase [Rhodospirillales bacterium]|nr:triose-phosphate isomerase [Rhodospirillales bacterium]MCB9995638.1 triose-phosphate isomerase [Rhodospirillales bacterium]